MIEKQICHYCHEKIDFSRASKYNNYVLNVHNSEKHERLKFEVFEKARRKGFVVITEARFKDGSGIADIYLPEIDWVIEILVSESFESFKKKNYPVKRIIPISEVEQIETVL